jgi:hypothetical protein
MRELVKRVTVKPPVLWGDGIVGFDRCRWQLANGRGSGCFRAGLSPRKSALTVYLMPGQRDFSDVLDDPGWRRLGRSRLYIQRLSDFDLYVLERPIRAGLGDMNRKYPM